MKGNATRVIIRVIAAIILVYAVVDIVRAILWFMGKKAGHLNVGVVLTLIAGLGILFLLDWARRLQIYLSLGGIALGLLALLVPQETLGEISFYSIFLQSNIFDVPDWLIVVVIAILALEVIFLIFPTTVRVFRKRNDTAETQAKAPPEEPQLSNVDFDPIVEDHVVSPESL